MTQTRLDLGNSFLHHPAFPRSAKYSPDWVLAGVSGGANPLWLAEWLTTAMDLRPDMRILDLGCGRALSSIFLHKEFGVEVWATDLWFSASENWQRIQDAGAGGSVFPLHADARALPFANHFFDAIVSIDSFMYYGTDDYFMNYLCQFLKPGGQIGIACTAILQEMDSGLPDHLQAWMAQDQAWSLHSAAWWKRHWERTGNLTVDVADSMPDGWKRWLDWHRTIAPDNTLEISTLEADQGQYLGYMRAVGRKLDKPGEEWPAPWQISIPPEYSRLSVMRDTVE